MCQIAEGSNRFSVGRCKERNFSINDNAAAAAPGWAGIEKPQPITSRLHAIYKRAPPSLGALRSAVATNASSVTRSL